MTDLKKPLTFVIIESEENCKYIVIGTLLSIQQLYPECTIVFVAREETRKLMKKMPIDLGCKIDYFDCDEIFNSKFNIIRNEC